MSIPLPPLPEPRRLNGEAEYAYEADQMHARDQEIVRCVLEAVANLCYDRHVVYYVTDAVRALEFKHHE